MSSLELNNPDVRHELLLARIRSGDRLVASALAKELNVSADTIRRDLIELERSGSARRVRGGAVPVSQPAKAFELRRQEVEPMIEQLAARAASLIDDRSTVFLDGGTMLHAVACRISTHFRGLVITPAPAIALAVQARGASVYLIGGTLCATGGIATGAQAVRMVNDCAADLCLLGACGMHPSFGLSADDVEEASLKRAMAMASSNVIVVTGSAKLARRARHRVLAIEEIDQLVTDVEADLDLLATIRAAKVEVHHG